ncbi:MAG: hypothetical protein NTZ65_03800 [Candidatus Berkelbacteria bacterium]|nr:hypothetical protein [Candidatus Berkelbacteria bacterium]
MESPPQTPACIGQSVAITDGLPTKTELISPCQTTKDTATPVPGSTATATPNTGTSTPGPTAIPRTIPDDGFTVEGLVIDSTTSSPLPNVSVSVRSSGGPTSSFTTGADGKYSVLVKGNSDQSNAYFITFSKPNYKTGYPNDQTTLNSLVNTTQFSAGAKYTSLQISMSKDTSGLAVTGSVTDQNNALLSGVNLNITSCQSSGGGPWTGESSASANTDPDIKAINPNANYLIPKIQKPTETEHQCLHITATKPGYTIQTYNNQPDSGGYTIYLVGSSQIYNVNIKLKDDNTITNTTTKKIPLVVDYRHGEDRIPGAKITISCTPNGSSTLTTEQCACKKLNPSLPKTITTGQTFVFDGDTANARFDNLYNIKIDNSPFLNYYISATPPSGYFFDLNQNGKVDTGEDKLKDFEIGKEYVLTATDETEYYSLSNLKPLRLAKIPKISGNFTVYGKIVDSNNKEKFVPDCKIKLIALNENGDGVDQLSTTSSPQLTWPTNVSQESKIANYYIENIPLTEGTYYELKATCAERNPSFQNGEPSTGSFQFSWSDVINSEKFHIKILSAPNLYASSNQPVENLKIKYFDNSNGKEINFKTEKITSAKVSCTRIDPYQYDENCMLSYSIDPNDPSIIVYHIKKLISWQSRVAVKVKAEHYYETNGLSTKSTEELQTDYLTLFQENKIICNIYNNVKFCTSSFIADKTFSIENIANLKRYALVINNLSSYIGLDSSKYPIIYIDISVFESIWSGGYPRDGAFYKPQHFGSLPEMVQELHPSSVIFLALERVNRDIGVLVHEFGHLADYESITGLKIDKDFHKAFLAAKGLMEDGKTPITGSDGRDVRSCSSIFYNYGCFSSYSQTTDYEQWAEFFMWWVLHNDEVTNAVNDPTMKLPENAHCYNTLMYMINLLNQKFPNMKHFSTKSLADTPAVSSDQIVTAATGDDTEFLKIMAEAGYTPASSPSTETVAPLSEMNLTPQQIAHGDFVKDNYDKLPTKQKVSIQLNIQETKVKNLFTQSLPATEIKKAIAAINKQAEVWLGKIGIHISSTKISGILQDQNGPAAGFLVKLGDKYSQTDNKGKFSFSKVQSGLLKFEVSDPKINKTFKLDASASIYITDNDQIKDANIIIFRDLYMMKGQIYSSNKPLVKGKIIVDGNQTINLDASGKFNFNLKEGQHSLAIKDSKGKTLKVTNSGKYGDLNKLPVTKNIDSLIWVK